MLSYFPEGFPEEKVSPPTQKDKAGVMKKAQQVELKQEGFVALPPTGAHYCTVKARSLVCSKVLLQAK